MRFDMESFKYGMKYVFLMTLAVLMVFCFFVAFDKAPKILSCQNIPLECKINWEEVINN